MTTYDGGLGTSVTVNSTDSSANIGFNSAIGLIGQNTTGSAADGEPVLLNSQSDADDAFGADSELAAAHAAAAANGAATIYGIDGTNQLDEAADTLAGLVRYVVPLTEDAAEVNTVLGAVKQRSNELTFSRVIAPAQPITAGDVTSVEPSGDDQRLVEVAPQMATVAGNMTYTAVAVAAHASRKPLGGSITYDTIVVDELGTKIRRSEGQLIERITAVTEDGKIVEGVTTSSEAAFTDIFQVEIVDTVTQAVDSIAQDFAGSRANTLANRLELEAAVESALGPLTQQRPPLLASASGGPAFTVDASLDGNNDTVQLTVGISPVDVMKQINIALNVGSVVEFEGLGA